MKKVFTVCILVFWGAFTIAQNSQLKILAIGDSNGEFDFGWVAQLQKIRLSDRIVNTAISGNTTGFDNLNRKELNTLRNVNSYLNKGDTELAGMDVILIMLGTNDCKAIFADSLKQVPLNMERLILKIKQHGVYRQYQPQIFIVSPPPFGPPEMLIAKYKGGAKRIKYLQKKFKKTARKENCIFIDIYSEIKDTFKNITSDGIHLTPEGQRQIAEIINLKVDKQMQKNGLFGGF
ncbi:SGNH/GDSL hydrolase family protein [Maribellus comscasis]|nr:GDSL-type esterase/lipase family protein [Maribellus comscasis]